MEIQKNEICSDCYSDEIVINPNNTKEIEYWCCNCRDITSTEIKESENIILCDEQKLYDNNYITQDQLNKLKQRGI